SVQVLNAGVESPSNLRRLPNGSVRRKRLYVPPLWSISGGSMPVASKLFAFLFRTGAIIEHELAETCGRNPTWRTAPTVESRAWAYDGIAIGLVFAKGVGLP